MPRSFCTTCEQHTDLITIRQATNLTGVTRSTIYYWMKKGWIHWTEMPSRRRLICRQSLFRASRSSTDVLMNISEAVARYKASWQDTIGVELFPFSHAGIEEVRQPAQCNCIRQSKCLVCDWNRNQHWEQQATSTDSEISSRCRCWMISTNQ